MRSSILAAAFVLAATSAGATEVHRFDATLAAPTASDSLVSSGVAWRCDGNACTARSELTSTPRRFCARLADDAGKLASFSVDGSAFDEESLTRCNASAD